MKTGITVTLLLLLVTGVQAADEQGQFSVRGAGLVNCEDFVQARQSGDQLYLVGIGWIDGYLTALNEYAADTYDITSFESTEMLVAMINRHCEIHPGDRLSVLRALIRDLRPDRLQHFSPRREVTRGERTVRLYQTLLERLQKRLADLGYYRGRFDGRYSEDTVLALKRYQTSINLNPTGFPDQTTLWRLLRSESSE